MNASMLSYILLSCVLLSVQAQNCQVSEIIRNTRSLLNKTQESCPCRETAATPCSCLPIPEPGHELACFVEGTKHMLEHNMTSNIKLLLLNQSFQIQRDRNLCESLTRGKKCEYKTKGTVRTFLEKILKTYQEIHKSRV
ncbi:interleukin 9 isoform X1 [Gallus gallus]|uniref:Interleukin-9 n=4 Tax=Gallus TaxID=9030 RepID=Q2PYN4_CHICK|nr:interleukin 9 precursor [Gallus gallus]XP_046756326.1 interleukin 9 isoform X1 [Gallus gallus]XP_046782950.1 interleukin 9 isoform X1 [Gallus gallus]ACR08278.1 interleukin 9 [Gallus lafayettii]ACR08298.1 interleukin 9 [Gallus varius]ACR08300.1 interleukin 9 [Gallus sonneratii]ABC02087.1 interleukin 9 [Gallus gallus]ACR08279.1 interleukin 9 [Gallus lafayettii]|eukprot:NP_001032914.1 interleukin 9 precursor [Gallus gallus]